MNVRVGLAEQAIVESEIFTRGHAVAFARQAYGSTVQLIIVSPVLKLLSNAIADHHLQLISVNSHVSLIKQSVQIAPQEETILRCMWAAAHAVRFNMSSLQHRQCAFPRDRTSTFINVGHNHSECALAKSRSNEHGFAVTDTLDCCYSRRAGVRVRSGAWRQSFGDRFPEGPAAGSVFAVVALSLDNVEAEIQRYWNPFCISEKEWFG